MARFELLAGQFIARDKTQPKAKIEHAITGRVVEEHPRRTYKGGEIVESDRDLVALHGADRFKRLGEPAPQGPITQEEIDRRGLATAPAFPGGQVHSGIQETRGGIPGPATLTREELEAQDKAQAATAAKVKAAQEGRGPAHETKPAEHAAHAAHEGRGPAHETKPAARGHTGPGGHPGHAGK